MPERAFPAELRKHCARFESISKVCEGTRINRQQFNKYLAGQAFPSARNLRKICAFLGVSEAELLTGQAHATRREGVRPQTAARDKFFSAIPEIDFVAPDHPIASRAGEWLRRGSPTAHNVLPAGHYECYFPLQCSSDLLLRTLLTLKLQGGRMSFVRRTYLNTIENGDRFAMRAKHHGIAVATARETFLIGSNMLPPHQPSILSIQSQPIAGRVYFTGLSLTCGLENQVATTVILQYLGSEKFARHALSRLGTVSRTDSTLDPVVARLAKAQADAGQSQIQWLDAKGLLAGTLAGGPNLARSKADRRLFG